MKNRKSKPKVDEPNSAPWGAARRAVVSLLVAVHLTAVFIAPFAFASASGPGAASPLADAMLRTLEPYVNFAFLRHGYFFFAPNPGPSHLIRYQIEFADGRPAQAGVFPDLEQHWPRLLYHRHFMLSEQLNARFTSPTPPPESAGPDAYDSWKRNRSLYEAQWRGFEEHLRSHYDADSISMYRMEHRLLTPWEFGEQHMKLTDPSLYVRLSETEAEGSEP